MTTIARPRTAESAHFYLPSGEPFYEVPYKDPSKGMRAATLADARKVGAYPSVTTTLSILDKPALNDWRVEQGVLAVLTSKQNDGEAIDAFVHRVLHVERVQDQESQKARDKGTEIHAAVESYFIGEETPEEMRPWIGPAVEALCAIGTLVCAEKILVGDGYAGRTDLILESPARWWIIDIKSTKNLPKSSWPEHVLQLSAYAAAWKTVMILSGDAATTFKPVRTVNCYISTVEQGKFIICQNPEDWQRDYNDGFRKVLETWCYLRGYKPEQTK